MNRGPPLFPANNNLMPTNPINLSGQLNGKPSNQTPSQSIKPHPLLPLPTNPMNPVNTASVIRPPAITNPQLVNFANRPPPGQPPINHPLLAGKHTNLPTNCMPLVTSQPPANLSIHRLPNSQLLQNPAPIGLLPPVNSPVRPHLLNPSIKPPHLLQTPLIANPLISSNPLVSQSIAQNGIQNSVLHSTVSNDQTSTVNKSPTSNDPQKSPSNGQYTNAENSDTQDGQPIDNLTDLSLVWVETVTSDGKTYFYNAKTRETNWNRPENCKKIITHVKQFMQQQQQQIKPNCDLKPQENTYPHQQLSFPMPGVMPPFAQFPMHPQLIMPPMMANMAANSQKMLLIPHEIRLAAMEWMEYKTPQGKPYYFSTKTQQSVWDKPKALIDFEQALNKLMTAEQNPPKVTQNKEEKKVDKNKPVSSTPIKGTPWCLVRTGDDRVFFFNPSAKLSVWTRPKELENNEEVDRLLNGEVGESSVVKKKEVDENGQQESKSNAITTTEEKDQNQTEQQQENPTTTATTVEKNEMETNNMVSEESNSSNINTDSNDKADADKPNNKRSSVEDEGSGKKQKVQNEEDTRKQMGITSIEAIASKQREQIPLEKRIEMFTEMLEEKGVSAFSTWEKELHKIVFSEKYLLLTSKERKQAFDKYTRERADKERKEKINKSKKQRQEFRDFLRDQFKEHKYSTRMTYAEFAKKHSTAEQFKLIDKIRDREQMFHGFIDEVKKRERDEKQREKDKSKDNFIELLNENQKLFDRHSHFSDVRDRFRDDPRYKALPTSQKEDLFRNFISNLPSSGSRHSKRSQSKERHHQKSTSSDKYSKDQRSSGDKVKNDDSDDSLERKERSKKTKIDEEDLDEGELNLSSSESEFKLEKDGLNDNENELTEEKKKELEKQKRVERSLKAREKQVAKEMQGHLMEREKHRNMLQKQELVENFNILLIDLIRNPDLSYREAKKVLKKDHRYDMFESLGRNEKEDLFDAHINNLIKKKRKMFIELLEETKQIKLNSSWRDVRRLIKNDPRYFQMSEKRCEKEFIYFLKEKLQKAKSDFKSLLKETKLITHKSRKLIETTDQQHLADIIVHLQNDKRYLDLDLIEDERRQLIIDYIEHLAKHPLPPPTSSSNRK